MGSSHKVLAGGPPRYIRGGLRFEALPTAGRPPATATAFLYFSIPPLGVNSSFPVNPYVPQFDVESKGPQKAPTPKGGDAKVQRSSRRFADELEPLKVRRSSAGFPGGRATPGAHIPARAQPTPAAAYAALHRARPFMLLWGKVWVPTGKWERLPEFPHKKKELAEGAAKDLRLLPVGGTGTRGWDEYKHTPTSDRTILIVTPTAA